MGHGAARIRPTAPGGAWQGASGVPGSRLVLNLDLPLQRRRMDVLSLGHAGAVLFRGWENVFPAGDGVSLTCLSPDPECKLIFLPFKDFYLCFSILFYNKAH